MPRKPVIDTSEELTRKTIPFSLGEQESPVELPIPTEEPEHTQTLVPKNSDPKEKGIESLANLFNAPRKLQASTTIPSSLYYALCRREGGVPKFIRDALDAPLTLYDVAMGAKSMFDARKGNSPTTLTVKISIEHHALVDRLVKEGTEAGIGGSNPSKIIAGVIWIKARALGLI